MTTELGWYLLWWVLGINALLVLGLCVGEYLTSGERRRVQRKRDRER